MDSACHQTSTRQRPESHSDPSSDPQLHPHTAEQVRHTTAQTRCRTDSRATHTKTDPDPDPIPTWSRLQGDGEDNKTGKERLSLSFTDTTQQRKKAVGDSKLETETKGKLQTGEKQTLGLRGEQLFECCGHRWRREHRGSFRRRVGLGWGGGQRLPRGTQHLKDCDDDPEEANGTAKDLHDENLYEEAGVLRIRQGSSTAHDAHTDATEEVGQAHCEASPKHGVSWRHEKGALRPSQTHKERRGQGPHMD